MKKLYKTLRASKLVSYLYYGLHIDDLPVLLNSKGYHKSLDGILQRYVSEKELLDFAYIKNLKKDIRQSYLKYKISPTEYFLFNFRNNAVKREEYISDKFIYMIMGKVMDRRLHDDELENKYGFYKLTASLFKREVMLVKSKDDYDAFVGFATQLGEVIVKPNASACGNGIKVFAINSETDVKEAFNYMVESGGEWIVEELIKQSKELASWNESSVNTIRISSFLAEKGFHILCPFIRTGRKGSIVDNCGQGGVYAAVDENTGKIITNGKDECYNVYESHPDSHITYKGWQVPDWNELLKLTEQVHNMMPKHKYIGWDFAHTDKGWILIEGNWGEFVAQQSAMEKGYKKEFLEYLV